MEEKRRLEGLVSRRRPRRAARQAEIAVERVRIGGIAAGGEGVGRLADGRAIFVHRTAPGEEVEVAVTTARSRYARGRLLSVLVPSPDRRQAPCPHYEDCGGCTVEHLDYPAQLRVKSQIVSDALRRIGGVDLDPPVVVPSPREFRYRNRVSFAVRRAGGRVHAGFHALHDPSRIIDIDGECLLFEEPIAAAWDRLRASWGPRAELLPAAPLLRLTLRATSDGLVSMLIEGGSDPGNPREVLDRVPEIAAIWHRPDDGSLAHVAGAPGLPERWGDSAFEVSGSAFLQVNRGAAAPLESYVEAVVGDVRGVRIVDAYCGIAAHGRRLAARGARVTGIELDPAAAAVGARLAAPPTAIQTGRVEDLLPLALPAELVILNPPRAGVAREALESILAQPPRRIVYVSCDPATLARDVRVLGEAYHPGPIRCFDMFPQTAHVETVLVLERRGGDES